jgi:hypothetical protein
VRGRYDTTDGHDADLEWLREDSSGVGNWCATTLAEERFALWLCPALLCYCDEAPPR